MLWPAVIHADGIHADLLAALVQQPIDASQLHAWPDEAADAVMQVLARGVHHDDASIRRSVAKLGEHISGTFVK